MTIYQTARPALSLQQRRGARDAGLLGFLIISGGLFVISIVVGILSAGLGPLFINASQNAAGASNAGSIVIWLPVVAVFGFIDLVVTPVVAPFVFWWMAHVFRPKFSA